MSVLDYDIRMDLEVISFVGVDCFKPLKTKRICFI
jgi:hypothetical protein